MVPGKFKIVQAGEMSTSKSKIYDQNRRFVDAWTEKYFFVNNSDAVTCFVCNSVVSVPKEYNVKRHYETKHKELLKLVGTERSRKLESLKKSLCTLPNLFKHESRELDSAVEVSLSVAQLIAKRGRPFTDGEFVKDCLLIASEKMCPETSKKFQKISLNRMTIQRRVLLLNDDLNRQLSEAAEQFDFFSLAVDEATDNTSVAQLLVFIRGISGNFVVTEELLGVYPMKGQTTGSQLLQALLELCANLNMKNLVSITTDGAPSMIGKTNGMVSLLRGHVGERESELIQYHCIIHQQSLCAKELGFDKLMKIVSDAINFIRTSALRHRKFKEFLEEFEDLPDDVIYYTEIRWLSHGAALKRFMELFTEIVTFLKENGKETRKMEEASFQCDLAFLTDTAGHLNNLNLQGKNQFIFHLVNQVTAFRRKLTLFKEHLKNKNFAHFPYCKKMKEKFPQMKMEYEDQIDILIKSFSERFVDFEKHHNLFKLFSNPFSVSVDTAPEDIQLSLIDLQCSDSLKSEFKETTILEFYHALPNKFSCLKCIAAKCATMFASTYICEQTFSLMTINKTKTRNRLCDESLQSILRIATSTMEPDIKHIASNIQSQSSH